MKKCATCQSLLETTAFWKKGTYFQSSCKECQKTLRLNSRIEHTCETCGSIFMARLDHIKDGNGKFCSLACSASAGGKAMRDKYPFQHGLNLPKQKQAWKAVEQASLLKQSCEVCETSKAEAHHDDYAKPLDIIWLCRKHHYDRHMLESALGQR